MAKVSIEGALPNAIVESPYKHGIYADAISDNYISGSTNDRISYGELSAALDSIIKIQSIFIGGGV